MSAIALDGVTKHFGAQRVVGPVSFEVAQGEFLSLLGPSGCGKTTTLRMIAGFESPTAGTVSIGGRVVNDVPVERRGIGMVFQSYALFPHLSVFENVAFGPRLRRRSTAEVTAKVENALALVGLEALHARMPRQLSGGQQQRVSLARAVAAEPAVLLLDEPLSNLDLKLREQMRDEIRRLQRRLGTTAVYVTHDQTEAIAVSDRIAVMTGGLIEQVGTPAEIYQAPATSFVARFIGQGSFLDGRVEGDSFVTQGGTRFALEKGKRGSVLVLRPESIQLGAAGAAVHDAEIEETVYLGDRSQVTLRLLPGGEKLLALLPAGRLRPIPASGERVRFSVDPADCAVVEESGNA